MRRRSPGRSVACASFFVVTVCSLGGGDAAGKGRFPGVVAGRVVDASGQPIAGAYVGAGEFGDSGGSNYERHRASGRHASTRSGADGEFELRGLAIRGREEVPLVHPIVVSHPDFVTARTSLVAARAPEREEIRLTPAATLRVRAEGEFPPATNVAWLIRLRALDGHRFTPPGRDPHLSAFRRSTWSQWQSTPVASFGSLRAGEYAIDVLRVALGEAGELPGTSGGVWIGSSGVRFHGATTVSAAAGEASEVAIRAEDHGTALDVHLPRIVRDGRELELPQIILLSRRAGLAVWSDDRVRSPESARLGRLTAAALTHGLAAAKTIRFENLPPGKYAIFAGPIVSPRGVAVEVVRRATNSVEIPWTDPIGESRVRLGGLERSLELGENAGRVISASEVIAILKTVLSPTKISLDERLRSATIELPEADSLAAWAMFEFLHARYGWRLEERGDGALVLLPSAASG